MDTNLISEKISLDLKNTISTEDTIKAQKCNSHNPNQ